MRHHQNEMRLTLTLFAILIFSSCATIGQKNFLYGKCSNGYLACTQFKLLEDNTFEYYIFMDVGGGTVLKGKWEALNGDTLILNTNNQPNVVKTYYNGHLNAELKDKVKIRIMDFEQPLAAAVLKVNDDEVKSADSNGAAYFNTTVIKKITYNYLGQSETIEIDNQDLNEIEITVKDLQLGAVPDYFANELVVAKKSEIIMYPNSSERSFRIKRARNGKTEWK